MTQRGLVVEGVADDLVGDDRGDEFGEDGQGDKHDGSFGMVVTSLGQGELAVSMGGRHAMSTGTSKHVVLEYAVASMGQGVFVRRCQIRCS